MNEFIIRAAKARETAVYGTRNETRDFARRCSVNALPKRKAKYQLSRKQSENVSLNQQAAIFEEGIYNLLIRLEEDNYRE